MSITFLEFVRRRAKERKQRWIAKHYGPGPHPGTGTPQSVHGKGKAEAKKLSATIKQLVPQENRRNLHLHKKTGLLGATDDKGNEIMTLMYNSKTLTLLAGSSLWDHADLHSTYAAKQNYDDFVKMIADFESKSLEVYLFSGTLRSEKDAWNIGIEAAKVARSVGFPGDTTLYIEFDYGYKAIDIEMALGEL